VEKLVEQELDSGVPGEINHVVGGTNFTRAR